MATRLVEYAASGQCGYREVMLPTVALRSNFSVKAWPAPLVEDHRLCGLHCFTPCPTDQGLVHPLKMCDASKVCARVADSIRNRSSAKANALLAHDG